MVYVFNLSIGNLAITTITITIVIKYFIKVDTNEPDLIVLPNSFFVELSIFLSFGDINGINISVEKLLIISTEYIANIVIVIPTIILYVEKKHITFSIIIIVVEKVICFFKNLFINNGY